MKKIILLACLTSSLSTGLLAADEYPDFEAYLGAGRYHWDNERNLKDTNSLELGAEISMTEALSLEAWFSSFDADIKNSSSELEGSRYTLGGLYHFSNKSLRPFISLGLGHLEFKDGSDNTHTEALAYLGLGLKKYFDNNVTLRAELLGLNSFDHEVTDLGARIAVGYAFGRSVTKPAMVSEQSSYKQETQNERSSQRKTFIQDKVSVVEPVQKIVATSPKVESTPVTKSIPAPIPELDSDHDGVVDSLDQCKSTNAAFKVDSTGCPIMLTETVSIKMNVTFPSNSAHISADNFVDIEKVADFMKQFDQTNVSVEGYSDDRGRAEYNKSLSHKRADAVRMALINTYKLDAKRINAIGFGEENPIANNNTSAGRAENRRVVAVVKSNIKKAAVK